MQAEYKKTILLVEDNAIIALAETNLIKKNGYDVIVAHNGEEAIRLTNNNPAIDLILMDIDLGKGIDGTEAAQRILKDRAIPIVFLSNHTEKEVVEKTEKITSYGYVVKTSGETVLIASIKMAFKLFNAYTEKAKSELMLIESDKKFHLLERHIDDVIWTMDVNFRFNYLSPSVEKMYGYTVDEMMKLNLQDYLTPESVQKAINVLADEISALLSHKVKKEVTTLYLEQIKKDGTVFAAETISRFLLDSDKKPIGMIGVTRDISGRIKAQTALEETEVKLKSIFQAAPIGIGVTQNRVFVELNETICNMVGYSTDELIGKSARILYLDDDEYEYVEQEKYKQIEKRGTGTVETKWKRKDGKIIDVLLSSTPFNLKDISVGVTFTALDITQRKEADEARRTSDEKYKQIVEGTRAILFNVDLRGRIFYINETAAVLVGYKREDLIDKFYLRFVHPDDRYFVNKSFKEQLVGLIPDRTIEFRYLKKDGSTGWLSFLTNQIYQNGKIVGLTGVAQNITLRKQMESELRENEARYRSIVENLNQAYYETNRRGAFTYCNAGFILISGYSEEELIGTIAFHLVAEEYRKEIISSYNNSMKQKLTDHTTEFKVQTKSGRKFWVEQVTHFEFDVNGEFVTSTNIIRDIDERKQAELLLKTAVLEKEALHRELLHRVKNSLSLIKSLIFIERERLTNTETRKVLEDLELRIGTISQMYSLLNQSGISQYIELGEYLNQMIKSLIHSYLDTSKNISVRSSLDEVHISPKSASSVGLIVNEIFTNALKYAFPDNAIGVISISLKKLNGNAEIEISDNGIGVPDGFRIEDSKGMGLQLVNLLARQLDGNITMESNNETIFKLVFPLDE
ncbi:MAG: PAS domain S-box protein [Ignavibacteriaceae bacterium]|nr:PAS domain S-box protein [Ignavibacterium sp.]MCC6253721.1 PAS domain S-box protein [Ignavibacteriaceae bacterium]HRN26371.1 PAS domain S-box protein [Ignavibacteriaceae bacterium]HRP91496.1 PAS domain S-box protein [Ignavibacteriaceae bacterium]HRQ54190.1 PAS domain S-box protein [Ignavibacteriaceae bacterium]